MPQSVFTFPRLGRQFGSGGRGQDVREIVKIHILKHSNQCTLYAVSGLPLM